MGLQREKKQSRKTAKCLVWPMGKWQYLLLSGKGLRGTDLSRK